MESNSNQLKPPLLQAQIIVGALLMGVLTFSAVAIAVGRNMQPISTSPQLVWLGAFIGMTAIVARRFVVRILMRSERARVLRQSPGADLAAQTQALLQTVFVKSTIMATAPLEGAVFANLVLYLVGQQPLSLAVAGVLFAGMAMQFPTQARLNGWLRLQQAMLEQERAATPVN